MFIVMAKPTPKHLFTLSLAIIIGAQGCSAFRPHTQMVNIYCDPEDALLQVNGERQNTTDQIEVPRNRQLSVQCSKSGYHPASKTVGTHLSTTGVLDIIGIFIFLLPGIGLFTPGAWDLDQTEISLQLHPK